MSHLVRIALAGLDGTVGGMAYTSDLTDEQRAVLAPVFNTPGKRGPRHAPDLRRVVDAMLYVYQRAVDWLRAAVVDGRVRTLAAGRSGRA